jgi:hypothetical protein
MKTENIIFQLVFPHKNDFQDVKKNEIIDKKMLKIINSIIVKKFKIRLHHP